MTSTFNPLWHLALMAASVEKPVSQMYDLEESITSLTARFDKKKDLNPPKYVICLEVIT